MALTTTFCVELGDTVKAKAQTVREKADRKVADSILMNSCKANSFKTTEATYRSYFSAGSTIHTISVLVSYTKRP
jgi:hypothetical protein